MKRIQKKLFQIIEDCSYIPFNPKTLELASIENYIEDLLLISKNDFGNLIKTKFDRISTG
jgi:hypothetical protein